MNSKEKFAGWILKLNTFLKANEKSLVRECTYEGRSHYLSYFDPFTWGELAQILGYNYQHKNAAKLGPKARRRNEHAACDVFDLIHELTCNGKPDPSSASVTAPRLHCHSRAGLPLDARLRPMPSYQQLRREAARSDFFAFILLLALTVIGVLTLGFIMYMIFFKPKKPMTDEELMAISDELVRKLDAIRRYLYIE